MAKRQTNRLRRAFLGTKHELVTEKGLPWNKTRVGDREGPSQAIRKIHDGTLLTIFISFRLN